MLPIVLVVIGLIAPGALIVAGKRALARRRFLASPRGALDADGPAALVGTLHAVGSPVTAPFTGRPAVSYRYRLARGRLRSNQPGVRVAITEAQGFVQARTVLRTSGRDIPILTALQPPGADEQWDLDKDPTLAPAVTRFLARGHLQPQRGALAPIISDGHLLDAPDGTVSHEVSTANLQLEGARERLVEEAILGEGADVTLLGTWSVARGGLVGIDEILPADTGAARALLLRRALVRFVVAALMALFAAGFAALYYAPQ